MPLKGRPESCLQALEQRLGSLLMDHGALGQTLNYLCLLFLIHEMGTTRPTSQICWEGKLDTVLESTLQSAVEVMSQQHDPHLAPKASSPGFPLWEMQVQMELPSSVPNKPSIHPALMCKAPGRTTLLCTGVCPLQNPC